MTRARSVSLAAVILCVLIGVLVGLSAFTFHTARGASYLSNDPAACINCHIMRDQHESWLKSSHHAFAVCNDCHVPHDFIGKYYTKAEHGLRHSWGFTFQNFHEPIQIKASSLAAVQSNCLRCHSDLVGDVVHQANINAPQQELDCIRCHQSVGHGANH